jgi:hypothetical protein
VDLIPVWISFTFGRAGTMGRTQNRRFGAFRSILVQFLARSRVFVDETQRELNTITNQLC